MILRRIAVEGWQRFANRVELGPLGEGLNIVHGPNGTGKSTLFLALRRGLCDSHKTRGDAMKTLCTWGRELPPQVTIDFEHDGTEYRICKQFLQGARSELYRLEGGHFVRFQEGPAADDFARGLLKAQAPARGPSDGREHWGLAQMLWATQGDLALEKLAEPARVSLQESLGRQMTSHEALGLERRLADAYGRAFTAGGKLKTGKDGPRLRHDQQQLDEWMRRRDEYRQKLERYEHAAQRIQMLLAQSQQSATQLQEKQAALAETRQRADTYRAAVAARDQRRTEAEAAQARFHEITSRIERLQSARHEYDECQKQLEQLEQEIPSIRTQLEQLSAQHDEANRHAQQVRQGRGAVEIAEQRARLAMDFVHQQRTVDDLKSTLEQVHRLRDEVNRAREVRQNLIAPDAKELAALRTAHARLAQAKIRYEQSLVTLEIQTEAMVEVEVQDAEVATRRAALAGEKLTFRGSPEVIVRVPEIGVLRAYGPSDNVENLRRDASEAEADWQRLVERYPCRDLEALQELSTQAAELDRQIRDGLKLGSDLLRGRKLEKLEAEYVEATARIAEILQSEPAWQTEPPLPSQLQAEASRIKEQFVKAIDAAESEVQRRRDAEHVVKTRLLRHEERLTHLRDQARKAKQRMESASDGLSDAEREERRKRALLDCGLAEEKCREAEKQLAAFGKDPLPLVEQLERETRALQTAHDEASRDLHTLQGELKQILAEAPYSHLAEAEEQVARLEAAIEQEQLQLEATRLLYETLMQCKREVAESLAAPVKQRAQKTLERLTGGRFASIEISEHFGAAGVIPREQQGQSVALDQISGGEREQVHFAVRLALADFVFPSGRQLVVLDDVFTYTDSERFAVVLELLQEAASKFQVVVLTCHPERYRALTEAHFFDLKALVDCSYEAHARSA